MFRNHTVPMQSPDYGTEAKELASILRKRIGGEVRFDVGSRALYATDLSMYRQVPVGVVIPRDVDDVIGTVDACHSLGVPILARGAGTSLAGQGCNVAVVIDFSKHLNRLLELDPLARTARVEPGVIYDQLRASTEQHHLMLGPDPATHAYCTIGGMIGNNACGAHSVMGGRTSDNVEELDILTYDGTRMSVGKTNETALDQIIAEGGRRGEIYGRLKALRDRYADEIRVRFPNIPRRVSGYNLVDLLPENGFNVASALVGTEGTCVTVLAAKMRLLSSPPHRALVVIGYPSLASAADEVPGLMAYHPTAVEGFHVHMIENMSRKGKFFAGTRLLPEGKTWLLVEYGGQTRQEAGEAAREAMGLIARSDKQHMGIKVLDDHGEQLAVWKIRESGVGASRIPDVEEAWPGWDDSAVAPEKLGDYLRELTAMLQRYGYGFTFYGHFGEGCVHLRVTFDTKTVEGVKKFRSFMEEAADLVVSYGGSLSGEHGDGQARGELLPKMFGPELTQAFREFKEIWDPQGKMNPGKVVDPYRLDQNLRTGPDYNPRTVVTHFQFPEDHGSFAAAAERCFGVGKCRGLDGGTMCPSFMATREEMHTTRGRAHLLFEMMRGEVLKDGWRDEHVKDSLNLCLACKGCKGECPVSVDLATYKAEFLSHYYANRLRPRHAYAFGLIYYWARLASLMPAAANFFTQTPLLADMAKIAAGMPAERQIPVFAPQPFKQWFKERGPQNLGRPKVILWADTFNNHFYAETAKAAVDVLEAAGYQVQVPTQSLCCGRPLYDYGMLNLAKRLLRQVLDTLRQEIIEGVPLVVLEPSCASIFRDELINLFPTDENAKRLNRQTYLLGEFLEKKAPHFQLPKLAGKAIVHGHCHQKAVMTMNDDESVISKMGLDYQLLDSGCCGMAGSFGFEKGDHYEVSIKVGERVLLPAIRDVAKDTLIIANGFSCREQIAQTTERRALHLAEVLRMALTAGADHALQDYPEAAYPRPEANYPTRRTVAIALGSTLLATVGLAMLSKNRSSEMRTTK